MGKDYINPLKKKKVSVSTMKQKDDVMREIQV